MIPMLNLITIGSHFLSVTIDSCFNPLVEILHRMLCFYCRISRVFHKFRNRNGENNFQVFKMQDKPLTPSTQKRCNSFRVSISASVCHKTRIDHFFVFEVPQSRYWWSQPCNNLRISIYWYASLPRKLVYLDVFPQQL